jgi:succinate-acetate transporter protein
MEAARPGSREADIGPAPVSAAVGWTPANPGPLGLAAFAATTFILSMLNTTLVNEAGGIGGVLAVALAYGGIAQLLAGMWEFRTGNTFGAVAFSSYGAFWISVFVLVKIGPPVTHSGFALYLYAWTIFTLLMLVASLRTNGVLVVVFLLLTITFLLLAIGNASLQGTQDVTNGTIKLGGWFGLATAAGAWYGALAGVANSTFGRDLLPVFPLNR